MVVVNPSGDKFFLLTYLVTVGIGDEKMWTFQDR
jgi:hypothetical protein